MRTLVGTIRNSALPFALILTGYVSDVLVSFYNFFVTKLGAKKNVFTRSVLARSPSTKSIKFQFLSILPFKSSDGVVAQRSVYSPPLQE